MSEKEAKEVKVDADKLVEVAAHGDERMKTKMCPITLNHPDGALYCVGAKCAFATIGFGKDGGFYYECAIPSIAGSLATLAATKPQGIIN